jgi:hypothetical protein
MIFIKRFDDHSDYTTFTGTTAFTLPNVSRCTDDDHVHFNPEPLPAKAYIYTGDTLINSIDLLFDGQYGTDGEYTYHPNTSDEIMLSTPYNSSTHQFAPFDRVEINLFAGAENVSVSYRASSYTLSWRMKGNKLIVEFAEQLTSYENIYFKILYTTSHGDAQTDVWVNQQAY